MHKVWSIQVACALLAGLLAAGCQLFVDDADREVYRLLEKRQAQAVGVVHDSRIDTEKVPIKPGESAYDFVPHPVDSEPPDSFTVAAAAPRTDLPSIVPPDIGTTSEEEGATGPGGALPAAPLSTSPPDTRPPSAPPATRPAAQNSEAAELEPPPTPLPGESEAMRQAMAFDRGAELITIEEALAYAFEHARDFQDAKEDLYLAALDLTLERHLWTPRFAGDIRSQYSEYGETRQFDRALESVARVAVEQRLPYGGQITAQVLGDLVRELTDNITQGESGQALIAAEIPLLRGAGPVAYETRYQAERRLIYAIRTFERFRRFLAVSVAADYFDLQQLKQQIVNAAENIEGLERISERSRAYFKAGRVTILDVQRAEQDQLGAANDMVDAVETYRTALDVFKIRIGMPTETSITVSMPAGLGFEGQIADAMGNAAATQPAAGVPEPLAESSAVAMDLAGGLVMPAVDVDEAVRVALKYRLDLLNELDRIGDAQRGVKIAENAILPALNAFGSVQFDTDPTTLGLLRYHTDHTTWRAGMTLELPLDRKAERNQLRESLIDKRRAERNFELARDTVVQQVRRAMRRVEQQRELVQIQLKNRALAQHRLRAAQFLYQKGQAQALEVVDAQRELLGAQNRLARAQASYKVSILEFWRDTDMLRVDDDGQWDFDLAQPSLAE